MTTAHELRIKKAQKNLSTDAVIIVSSAPPARYSRDIYYPYRQDSDFFYLTGSNEPSLSLIISGGSSKPLLLAPPRDRHKELWEGKGENYRSIAKSLNSDLKITKQQEADLRAALKGVKILYHQNTLGTISYKVASDLQAIDPSDRGDFPTSLKSLDEILVPLRLKKEKDEIAYIKEASRLSAEALFLSLPTIQPKIQEHLVKATIDYWLAVQDSTPSFGTIVASGPSASVLHYVKGYRALQNGVPLLIDWGGSFKGYGSDITRMLPVGGKFEGIYADLYDIVLMSQKAALKTVKHGVKVKKVYDAAAKVLTEGLISLKVLKGSLKSNLDKETYKAYFPHGIGHTLGLDAHDVGNIRGNNGATLETGMVFTVEPGLYFTKKIGKVPSCGFRIEDSVLVTKAGCEILTPQVPKERSDVEELMSSAY